MLKLLPGKAFLTLVLTVGPTSLLLAQDAPSGSKPDAARPDAASPELFKIPEGTPEELFAYMNTIKRTQPAQEQQTREGNIAHLKAQVAAVLAVCDKIEATNPAEAIQVKLIQERMGAYQALSQVDEGAVTKLKELMAGLEKDERPEVIRLLMGQKLKTTARGFFALSEEQQAQLVRDLYSYLDRFGLDGTSFGLGNALGEALEESDTPQMAAGIYERLAAELRKTKDPGVEEEIARFEATARRLNLPGNFMDITGTTADGEKFDWASYRGKVVLVDFWASWCGPCRAEIPNMKAQLEKYGPKGFAIVGINLDNTKEDYQRYVDREGLTWVNLMSPREAERGWNNPLAVHYGVSGIPTAILVDQKGHVVSMMARGEDLNRLLNKLLGDVPDTVDEKQ